MKNEIYSIEDSDTIFNINSKGWYLKGWSRAGLKTGFLLYPFKILFDCGIYTSSKPEIIFLTHQHVDHTQSIPYICTRHKPTMSTIYLPESSIKFITKYERVISELSDPKAEIFTDDEILIHQKIKLIGTNPGDIINLTKICGNQELQIEVLKAYHDVQSNGYGISSYSKKIKPEYEYLTAHSNLTDDKINKINKIKELKSRNIDMYEKILVHEFAFFCDSTIHNLSTETEWKKYPVIICECTGLNFFEMNSKRDLERNHSSLFALKPIMLENKDKKWFIIHVSLACTEETIKQIESELKNEGLDVKICI
jgi:ribonuclease BN (tRNA processing enzyme)